MSDPKCRVINHLQSLDSSASNAGKGLMDVSNKLRLTFLLSLFFSAVSLDSVVVELRSSEQLIEHLALADAEHDTVKGKIFKECFMGQVKCKTL